MKILGRGNKYQKQWRITRLVKTTTAWEGMDEKTKGGVGRKGKEGYENRLVTLRVDSQAGRRKEEGSNLVTTPML